MSLGKRPFFSSPIFFIRLFIPLVFGVTAWVYTRTLFQQAYPGESSLLTAVAAKLCKTSDLSHPLFTLLTQFIASLPYASLTERLNLFCAACGSIAVTLAYYFTARVIFVSGRDLPGGAASVIFQTEKDEGDDTDDETLVRIEKNTPASDGPQPLSSADNMSSTEDDQEEGDDDLLRHNWLAAQAGVLGGLATATVLAFTAPFWLASTRLYPHAFHLMLVLLILNLLLTYFHTGSSFALFQVILLLTATCLENPLFLLLLPVGGFFLLKTMEDNEQLAMHRMLGVIMVAIAGLLMAITCLYKAAPYCVQITSASNRLLLATYGSTLLANILEWIPGYDWSYMVALFLLPSAIALYIFTKAFHGQRTFLLLATEVGLALVCVPALLNLRRSLWGIARSSSEIPLLPHVMIALFVGLLFAVFYLMRDVFVAHGDEDLEYYEYRDNPVLCRIGSLLCWPLAVLICVTPFRNQPDISPKVGSFVDTVTKDLYWSLGTRDWLINNSFFQYQLMMHAFNDQRTLHFISTDPVSSSYSAAALTESVMKDPSFEPIRNRMLNAIDISPNNFLGEWLRKDSNACNRIAIFQNPGVWRQNGYHAVPSGFFLKGVPQTTALDLDSLLKACNDFIDALQPHLFPEQADTIKLFTSYRQQLRVQLSRQLNELAFLFVDAKRTQEADAIYKQADELAHNGNPSALLNRYQLILDKNGDIPEEIGTALRHLVESGRLNDLTARAIQNEHGTLLKFEVVDMVRKNFGRKVTGFKNLFLKDKTVRDPLLVMRDKKREMYHTVTKAVQEYRFEDAEHLLNILFEIDSKDVFVLLNKAKIAIEKRDAPEAGLWMDLARENGVSEAELTWYQASLLVFDGKLDEARDLLNRAIPSNTQDPNLWSLLADILLEKGEYYELENRVSPALRNATSKTPSASFYKLKGYLLLRNNDLMGARAAFLDALGLNSSLTSVREELLRIDDQLAVPTFSEADAKEMLRLVPDHAFSNYLLGRARLDRGAFGQAEDLFKRSLEKSKANVPAAVGLAALWLEQSVLSGKGELDKERFAQAEALLRAALKKEENNTFARQTLIKLLVIKGSGDEAFLLIQPLLKERPADLDLRLTYIRIRMQQGKIEEASQLVSDLLDKEYKLPPHTQAQLKLLAKQLTDTITQ